MQTRRSRFSETGAGVALFVLGGTASARRMIAGVEWGMTARRPKVKHRSSISVWAFGLAFLISAIAAPARACPNAIAGTRTGAGSSPLGGPTVTWIARDGRTGRQSAAPAERIRGSEDDDGGASLEMAPNPFESTCGDLGGAVMGSQGGSDPSALRAGSNVKVRGP